MAHARIYSNHHLSKKSKKIGQEFRVKSFTDYDEMLDSVECDAVSIVTSDFVHAKSVVTVVKRNKHFLCF